jgi:hypothetical protein
MWRIVISATSVRPKNEENKTSATDLIELGVFDLFHYVSPVS